MKELLIFTAPNCVHCGPVKLNAQGLDTTVVLYDAFQDRDVFIEYGVRAVPTLILEQDGKEVARHAGTMTRSDMEGFIERSLQ